MATEESLLASIGIPTIQNNDLTADDLIERHHLFMDNGQSVDMNVLVSILGGTDAILQHYLSSNNTTPLTVNQLNDINDLLNNNNDIFKQDAHILRVSSGNTLLHQLFGERIATKTVHMMYSKPMVIAAGFLIAITMLLDVSFVIEMAMKYHQPLSVCLCVLDFVLIMYILLSILSVNKTILKYILQTFIFWFKILFAVKYGVCYIIYQQRKLEIYASNILFWILTVMFISWYALIDGINMPLRVKIGIGIMGSLYFLYISIVYWTFVITEPCFITINWSNSHSSQLDMREWASSAIRVVTIFMCKQAIYSIWDASKSTLIKKSVAIVWE